MKRRHAIVLALLWVAGLVAFDLWWLKELRVPHIRLERVLGEMFEAPVTFGELSIGLGGVSVSDVRLMRPDRPDKLYGTIDEVRVAPRWLELLTHLELDVEEIAVSNPTLVVQWNEADGTFDMPSPLRSDLEARTRTMGELPAIALNGLTLVLENPPDIVKKQQVFEFGQLSVTLAPEGSARWLYRFEVDVDHPILGRMSGTGRFSRGAFEIEVQRKGLMVTPDLLKVVRPPVKDALEKFVVDGDLTVTATVGPAEGKAAEIFAGTLDCRGMNVRFRDWPQALSSIQGRIQYAGGRLSTEGLTASFEQAPVHVAGFLDLGEAKELLSVTGNVIGLKVTNDLAARTRRLPEPGPTIADQIEAWDPNGFANATFRLDQDRASGGASDPLRAAIDVEFKGGTTVRYIGHVGDDGQRHGFGYPLRDLRGVLHFTEKAVSFERLTASNGPLSVEARGRIDYEHGGDETYDVDVEAHGLELDGRVSDALTGGSRELFNSLDAQGTADLVVGVKRKKGEPPGARVDVLVDLQGVALRPRQFPLDFADARGRVMIPDSGRIRIEGVTARRHGGSFTLEGAVPTKSGMGDLDLRVAFEKFPVDPQLTAALKELVPAASATIADLNASGRVQGVLHVVTGEEGSVSELTGSIAFEDMTLASEDPSVRIEDLDGSVALAPSVITINEGTTARIAGERFAVKGTIKGGSELALVIEADNFHVDRELVAEVEPMIPWIRRYEAKPEVEGPMSMDLVVTGTASEPEFAVVVDLLGLDVTAPTLTGVRMREVKGHVEVGVDGKVSFRDVSARLPSSPPAQSRATPGTPGAVEPPPPAVTLEVASGTWTPPDPGKPSASGKLALGPSTINGLDLSSSLVAVLPIGEGLRQQVADLALVATVDLRIGKLTWEEGRLSAGKSRLAATRVSLGTERTIKADSFVVDRLSVDASAGGLDIRGNFTFVGARFLDIPVPMMVGKIAADFGGVRFESVEADLFAYETRDGRKFSLGKLNPETSRFDLRFDGGSFDGRLRFQECNLPAAIRVFGGDPGKISGTFSAGLDLRGTLGDSQTYEGNGTLAVRARNVVSLPVFYKMFNSLDVLQVFEKSDPWTRIDVDFAIEKRVMRMGRIRIDSPDVLLEGPGTLTFEGIVDADLKANQGVGISPIGWVTRLISHVVFAGIRVNGPIGDPRVDPYSIGGR